MLALIREFDARRGWGNGSDFRSCAHWLSWRVGLDLGAARERVRVARALGTLPNLAEALARGELSYSKVRALTRVATPQSEERLLEVGKTSTADEVERTVRSWRHLEPIAEATQGTRRHRSRALQVYRDADGMVVVNGRQDQETGAVLMKALDAAREALYQRRRGGLINKNVSAETSQGVPVELAHEPAAYLPSFGQQQVDALALLAETALQHGLDGETLGERYQVVVHVDAAVLAEADAPTGCRFPGCGLPFGQGHHIRHWAHGGPTTLSNLVMLCRRHHRSVHEEGYQIERQEDGALRFRRPDGELLPHVPAPPAVSGDPVRSLHIDAQTAKPGCGEGLDVGERVSA